MNVITSFQIQARDLRKIKGRQFIIVSKDISNRNRKERKRSILKNGELYKEQEPVLKESGGRSERRGQRINRGPTIPSTVPTHYIYPSPPFPVPFISASFRSCILVDDDRGQYSNIPYPCTLSNLIIHCVECE